MEKKNKKKSIGVVYHEFDSSGVLSVALSQKENTQNVSFELGASEARLDEEFLELNPKLMRQIVLFGERLATQLKCDGVRIFSINFGKFNYVNKQR